MLLRSTLGYKLTFKLQNEFILRSIKTMLLKTLESSNRGANKPSCQLIQIMWAVFDYSAPLQATASNKSN